jgi:fructose-bisphosphate aldolase class II
MFSDLQVYMGESSPYRKLRVMPALDHAFPWLDGDVLEEYADQFATVMCDASEKPFDENVRLTAQYVDKVYGRVVVEGAVDEIYEAGGVEEKNEPTTVEQARRFLAETGVDIIVPNVGTEHRATAGEVRYHSSCAREISAAVGKILCLHGTSSLGGKQLGELPRDGFVKVNIYTTLAVHGGQAVARQVLKSLPDMFDEGQLRQLAEDGIVSEALLASEHPQAIAPKLASLTNPPRRDAWFGAVKGRCIELLEALNYRRYAMGSRPIGRT